MENLAATAIPQDTGALIDDITARFRLESDRLCSHLGSGA